MKNRQWNKLTTNKCKQSCNEWCCPCNDGSTGCYANDFFEMLCDNSTTAHIFRGEEDLFDKLQAESYNRMVESYDNPEIYEEFCEKFVDELCEKHEEESEPMPICNDENGAMPYETPKVNWNVDGYIPIEWVKKFRNQFETTDDYYNVIDYMLQLWKKENETNRCR